MPLPRRPNPRGLCGAANFSDTLEAYNFALLNKLTLAQAEE
ncbi:MAG TPA: hypothetical protein VMZ52_20035 [Bryobacteraceae bacterium]|nr:hypothetical protein [Bryobacteraceae bacterium]